MEAEKGVLVCVSLTKYFLVIVVILKKESYLLLLYFLYSLCGDTYDTGLYAVHCKKIAGHNVIAIIPATVLY